MSSNIPWIEDPITTCTHLETIGYVDGIVPRDDAGTVGSRDGHVRDALGRGETVLGAVAVHSRSLNNSAQCGRSSMNIPRSSSVSAQGKSWKRLKKRLPSSTKMYSPRETGGLYPFDPIPFVDEVSRVACECFAFLQCICWFEVLGFVHHIKLR